MEMVLGGEPISAEEAKQWHLVSQVHPADQLYDAAIKLAERLSKFS